MATVVFIEPNITQEENERRWDEVKKVLDEIAQDLIAKGITTLEE